MADDICGKSLSSLVDVHNNEDASILMIVVLV